MAGAKGRSGGARPGAGRPPKAPECLTVNDAHGTPESFLESVMNDKSADARIRVDAAKALLSAKLRMSESKGKKQSRLEDAEKVASKFAAGRPPLRVVGDK